MYSDQHVGNADRYGVRGSLTIKPADGIENNTVVDYFSADETNTAAVIWNVDPTQLTTLPVGVIYSPALDQIVFSGAWNAYLAGHPKADPNGLPAFLLEQRSRGPFTIDSQGSNSFRADNLVTTNITTIDIGGNTLKNVLGYGHFKYDNPNASFGVPYVVNNQFSNVATNEQFSEELQWQAKAFDDKLNYTTGFFYNRETSDNSVLTDVIEFLPFQPDFNVHHIWGIKSKTYAAYAQGTYDLSDATGLHGLAATLGARYTNEKVALANRPGDDGYIPALTDPTQAVNQEQTFKNVSWVARLEEQLNDQVLIYTTVRKAYRNGGYNGVIAPVIGDGTDGGVSYKTQTVTDVELGFKFEGHLGEMPTRLNLAGFNSWIKDDQRVAYTFDNFGNPGAITVNVPKARVRGVEFDSNIRLTQWLEIGAVANYTDAEFTDDKVSILGRPPVEFGTYPYAPEFSGSVFAELTFPVAAAMQLTVRGEEYYQSSMFFSSTGNLNPGSELPEYATTNFQVGLENPDAGWSVVANLKNAFNRVYYTGGVSALQLFQVASTVPGAPRTLRVEARYKF
jgi:iron complex outermembrane receptor protein